MSHRDTIKKHPRPPPIVLPEECVEENDIKLCPFSYTIVWHSKKRFKPNASKFLKINENELAKNLKAYLKLQDD